MERPEAGRAVELEAGIRMIVAPNPSPMTYWGTNTYLIGTGDLGVIDPGPDDPAHLAAILGAAVGSRVSHILVTHAHRDHSPLARRLARETGAEIVAFGRARDGRRPVMERLAAEGLTGGGEGIDADFAPDTRLSDGQIVHGNGWRLEALHTPGHLCSHLAFALGDAVFTGDHVMGWASSLVSPPDGDLTDFMESCARLRTRTDRVFYPGHGAPVTAPAERLDWLVTHRRAREAAILAALGDRPRSLDALTAEVYADVPPAMHPAARRNLLAHLIDLHERGRIEARPTLAETAGFRLAP